MAKKMIFRDGNNEISRQKLRKEGVFEKNNKAWMSGVLQNEFDYLSENTKDILKSHLVTKRISGIQDIIPVVISSNTLEKYGYLNTNLVGRYVEIGGSFRSKNQRDNEGKSHLQLYFYITYIHVCDSMEALEDNWNANLIFLDGFICKNPVFRITPSGKKICDLHVAVNREDGNSDYIPCIVWNDAAKYVSEYEMGTEVALYGRIQSREYFKRFSCDSDEGVYKTVYEISVIFIRKK